MEKKLYTWSMFEWLDGLQQQQSMNHTLNKQSTLPHSRPRDPEDSLLAGEVPEHVRQLLIDNKRMQKRIQVLEREIEEKGRVIAELKDHLDQGVIESTQQKISYYRNMEEAVERQLQQEKQRLVEQELELQEQLRHSEAEIEGMRVRLREEIGKNEFLLQKIESLKEYIVDIIEEKDYLIAELAAIINEQQAAKADPPIDAAVPVQGKRKAAFIKKNQ